jgi:hypothetical protein
VSDLDFEEGSRTGYRRNVASVRSPFSVILYIAARRLADFPVEPLPCRQNFAKTPHRPEVQN